MSPDATAFAHIVDDGGYPRAVQRFLTGRHASSSRSVDLPVEGPITRIIHSADGHWLACQMAPDGGTRTQVWVVTTDPDDRAARRVDFERDSTAELVGWDGTRVLISATDETGRTESRVVDPRTADATVLDSRPGARLVDAWTGSALLRVGPRGSRELLLLRGRRETPLLPSDLGSTTDVGVVLDDHVVRRLPPTTMLYHPSKDFGFGSARGYVRAIVRSDNGCDRTRLLEVTVTEHGTSYHVLAERTDCDLDEFAVSDDLSTVAILWNNYGCSELQILRLPDEELDEPIPLPGPVASELSISAGGSMVALTVEGPGMPKSVQLVGTSSREWEPIEPSRSLGTPAYAPELQIFTARDGLELSGWLYRAGDEPGPVLLFLHGGPEGQERPGFSELYPALVAAGISVFAPNVRGSGGLGRSFSHADDVELRFGAIDDVADCVAFLIETGVADPARVVCSGWSYGGYLTLAALTFHPTLFAGGISMCGMSDLGSFYANTETWIARAAYSKYGHPEHDRELLESLSPMPRIGELRAPVLVVHGAHDTNVPVTESEQLVKAVRAGGGSAELLMFPDEGHAIVKQENRLIVVKSVVEWVLQRVP